MWEGRFTFGGKLPPPPRYTNCAKVYPGGNAGSVCPSVGDVVTVSSGPSPEVAKAAEKDRKMKALQAQIAEAARIPDMAKVQELSAKMKALMAED